MTTERQIRANRANALKSTGPRTPEGKRISSKNRSLRGLVAGPPILKGRALCRYTDLAAAFMLEFLPRNSAETALVHTLTVARWNLQRLWANQTAFFQRELDRARKDHPSESPAALAAIAFEALTAPAWVPRTPRTPNHSAEPGSVVRPSSSRGLADPSCPFTLQHRLETHYDHQFDQALAKLLKLRKVPKTRAATQHAAKPAAKNFSTEANSTATFGPYSEKDLVNNK
jgi:hypothetical protein